MKRILGLVLVLLVGRASAFVTPDDTTVCKPGRWTSNLEKAREYAKAKGTFYLVNFTKTGGCGFCGGAASAVWNQQAFKDWSKENDIPIVVADCSAMTPAAQTFSDLYIDSATGVPLIACIDGADGVSLYGLDIFHGASALNGVRGASIVAGSFGAYLDALEPTSPALLFDLYLNKRDNEPVAGEKSGYYYPAQATTVKPDGKVNGLFGSWEVNSLSCKTYVKGALVLCQSEDRQDWYKFDVDKETSYIVKCPTLSDKGGLGYLGVYTTEKAAKAAAKSFAAAKENAGDRWFPMSDLKAGRAFTVPKCTAYLAFVRRAAKAKENITLTYTFTLEKGAMDVFEFDSATADFDEYDTNTVSWVTAPDVITNECRLTVRRATTGAAATAMISFADGSAKKGVDYLVTSTTATFGAADKTATVPFKIISKRGVWTGDRSFTATITKDAKAGGSNPCTVTIRDVDPAKDADDPQNDDRTGATALSLSGTVVTNRLNGVLAGGYDDRMDWFKFTGRDQTKIACLKFKPLVKSDAKNSFELKFYRDDEPIHLPESHSTEVTGMEAFTVALPTNYFPQSANIYLCVSNKTAKSSHCGVYELSVMQIDQMVASFAAEVPAEVAYDSPRAASNVAYRVVLTTNKTSQAEYADLNDWTIYLPTWRTLDRTAKNGTDYAGTSPEGTGVIVKNANELITQWQLLVPPKFRPDRTLTVELLPDPYGYYRLGDKPSVAVTIKGDNTLPSPAVTNTVVSGGGFAVAEGRNLNYTNEVDALYFDGIKAGRDYVLGVDSNRWASVDEMKLAVYTNVTTVSEQASDDLWMVSLATNELGVATNGCWAVTNRLGVADAQFTALTNEFGVATNVFNVAIFTTNFIYRAYDKDVSNRVVSVTNRLDVSSKTNTAYIAFSSVSVTNEVQWERYWNGEQKTWSVPDLTDPEKMPILRFLADGQIKVQLSRWKNKPETLFEYGVKLTEWRLATVSFAKAAWTNLQTDAVCSYKVTLDRACELPLTLHTGLKCLTARDGTDVEAYEDRVVVIPAGETASDLTVSNLMAATAATRWSGDRDFELSFSVEDVKFTAGDITCATGVLQSVIAEYEAGDSAAESKEHPAVTNAMDRVWPTDGVKRTMHGADKSDCFLFTNLTQGVTYRFWLKNLQTNDVGKLTAAVYEDDTRTGVAIDDLLSGVFDYTMNGDGGELVFVLTRSAVSTAEKPVSMAYELTFREWPWPTFSFDDAALEAQNAGEGTNVTFRILRDEDNCEGTNWVKVTLNEMTNTHASATTPKLGTTKKFTFLPGQSETNWTVSVRSPEKTAEGVWTGDWAFTASLTVETDPAKDKVRLGDPSNCVVTVSDVVKELDWHDRCNGGNDDDWEDLETNHVIQAVVQTLDECRLNGTDDHDWFRFTDIRADMSYHFGLSVSKTNELGATGVRVEFWSVSGTDERTALTPLAADSVKQQYVVKPETDDDILVRIYRDKSGKDAKVSCAYELSFNEIATSVYLTPGSVRVSKACDYVSLDLVCTNTSGDGTLSLPVSVTVTPVEGSAKAPKNFLATPLAFDWEEASYGGVKTVRIPLTNYDKVWEGDKTFSVRLDVESGAEGVQNETLGMYTNVTVTLLEVNAPQYGTVAITGAGDPVQSVGNASAVFDAVEGGRVNVQLTRADGITGDVVLNWYWKDADNKTVKYGGVSSYYCTTNFVEGTSGTLLFQIPVPEKGLAVERENWKLGYKLVNKDVTVAKGSPTTLTFDVAACNYGGRLSDYSAGRPGSVVFKTSGAAWYNGVWSKDDAASAYVRAMTPAVGKSSAMTASVTGPGTLTFRAKFVNAPTSVLTVTGGDEDLTVKDDGACQVHVTGGTKTLTFAFTRKSPDGNLATVEISNVVFTPDAVRNLTGTYVGPVSVDGVPGLATLTVSAAGKTSGKLQCADRTWTLSTNCVWNVDGVLTVTVKNGKLRRAVVLGIDAESGIVTNATDDGVALTLSRKAWQDKPLAAVAAAAVTKYAGYYTGLLDLRTPVAEEDRSGFGTLTLKVSENGSVKVAGTLPDGRGISLSAQLSLTADGALRTYAFTSPVAYKKGWFALPIAFSGDDIRTLRRADCAPVPTSAANWVSFAAGASFERVVDVFGEEYTRETLGEQTPDLTVVLDEALADAILVVGKKTYPAGAVEVRTLKPNWNTGVLSGSVAVKFVEEGTAKVRTTKTYSYKGVFVGPNAGLDALVGGGLLLIGDKSYQVGIQRAE